MSDRSEHTEGQWAAGGGGGSGGGKKRPEGGGGGGGEIDWGRSVWTSAKGQSGNDGIDTIELRAWVRAMGIDPAKLPGGQVPPWIRWHPKCPSKWESRDGKTCRTYEPAIVAMAYGPVVGGKGTVDPAARTTGWGITGVWCGFPGQTGTVGAGVALLTPGPFPQGRGTGEEPPATPSAPMPSANMPSAGPWVLREAVEGKGKARGFCQLRRVIPGGVLIATEDLETALVAAAATAGRVKGGNCDGESVTAWAWLGDHGFSGISLPKRGPGSPGTRPDCVRTMILAAPLEKGTAGLLAIAANSIADKAKALTGISIDVQVRVPSVKLAPKLVVAGDDGSERPAGDAKRVSWGDVFREYGADAVAKGLLDGIEVRREDGDGAGDGGEGNGWVTLDDSGERRRLLPAEDLLLAQRFLDEFYSPPCGPEGELAHRAGRCHFLIQFRDADEGDKEKGTFCEWDQAAGAWVDIPYSSIEDQLREWMTGCARAKATKHGFEYVPYNPTLAKVRAVRVALAQQVQIVGTAKLPVRRFWLEPTFDSLGRPKRGRSKLKHRERIGDAPEGQPPAEELLCFRNAHVDAIALSQNRFEWQPPTELLFNQTVFPYELPLAEVSEAIVADDWKRLLNKYCPTWRNVFLPGLGWGPEQISVLQQTFGYVQRTDVSQKQANLVFLFGPGDAGKGCVITALELAVGLENTTVTSLEEMSDKPHMVTWRNKLVAIADEQGEGGEKGKLGKRILKVVTGGGRVGMRGLYQNEQLERLNTRVLISVNDPPDLRDASGAVMNRAIMFEFRKSRTGEIDPTVKARIAEEGLGIVLWAMAGHVGRPMIKQPRESSSALDLFTDASARYNRFIEEWVAFEHEGGGVLPESCELAVDDLYRAWCANANQDYEPGRRRDWFRNEIYSPMRKKGWMGEYKGDGTPRFNKIALTRAATQAIEAERKRVEEAARDRQWRRGGPPTGDEQGMFKAVASSPTPGTGYAQPVLPLNSLDEPSASPNPPTEK